MLKNKKEPKSYLRVHIELTYARQQTERERLAREFGPNKFRNSIKREGKCAASPFLQHPLTLLSITNIPQSKSFQLQ